MSYKLFDHESGEYLEVSKDAYESHKQWMDKVKATIKIDKLVGRVIITSSTAEDGNDNFKELWQETKFE